MIKVLVLTSSPTDRTSVDYQTEVEVIHSVVDDSPGRDLINVQQRNWVRVEDIAKHVLKLQPTVVHYCGHSDALSLVLHGDDDKGHEVAGNVISSIVEAAADGVRLVVLNSCESEEIAKGLLKAADIVIGMREEIANEAADSFAAAFYECVANGRSTQDAFNVAKEVLEAKDFEGDPQLWHRRGVNASRQALVVLPKKDPSGLASLADLEAQVALLGGVPRFVHPHVYEVLVDAVRRGHHEYSGDPLIAGTAGALCDLGVLRPTYGEGNYELVPRFRQAARQWIEAWQVARTQRR